MSCQESFGESKSVFHKSAKTFPTIADLEWTFQWFIMDIVLTMALVIQDKKLQAHLWYLSSAKFRWVDLTIDKTSQAQQCVTGQQLLTH